MIDTRIRHSKSPAAAEPKTPGIEIHDLHRRYERSNGDPVIALDSIDLTIRSGEFLSIVGPSGCGKSTLLRILAGLDEATSGSAVLTPSSPARILRAMVFQAGGIFPWMTILENVAYGLTVRGAPKAQRREVATSYLTRLGLGDFLHAYPRELSGGMNQRAGVARAFATEPEFLLMDEPFASIDELSRVAAHADLLDLWQADRNTTVVYITHSLDEAVLLSDRVALMTKRPGRIKEVIDVDLDRPRSVADLKGDSRFEKLRSRLWNALKEEVLDDNG